MVAAFNTIACEGKKNKSVKKDRRVHTESLHFLWLWKRPVGFSRFSLTSTKPLSGTKQVRPHL